uniref:Sodium-dependent multivitamin transporter n=1 Tax=Photinus pyralis TaxID=7054 RepID=A0A1Y1MQF8_PHOPY
MATNGFTWIDYAIFTIVTAISCIVGLYFGLFSRQKTIEDYLFGGKNMKWFAVSISLTASALSSHSIVGLATEVYLHGSQVILMTFSIALASLANYFLYVPVFSNLKMTSIFEYLEMRFNGFLRKLIMLIAVGTYMCVLPLCMYTPSLTFSQATGVNLYIIASVMTCVCMLYTSLGGIKGVTWSDVVQLSITITLVIALIVMGIVSTGSVSEVIHRASDGDRLKIFDFNPDPTVRVSFWTILLGSTATSCVTLCTSPHEVQRYSTIPRRLIPRLIASYSTIYTFAKMLCMTLGLVMYAKYFDCDPKSIGAIKKADQVLPYFITELTTSIPGFNGLFLAAFFGSSLSIYSTLLNTLSGIVYNDIAPWIISEKLLRKAPSFIMKLLVVIFGLLSIAFIYLLENGGTVFELSYYVRGTTGGTMFGVFTLGVLLPFANSKGAFLGAIASVLLMGVIVVNNSIYVRNGFIHHSPKSLHTYGCNTTTFSNFTLNVTATPQPPSPETSFWLFRVSFQYFELIGAMTTIVIGAVVSWVTKTEDNQVINPKLLTPIVRKYCRPVQEAQDQEIGPLKETVKNVVSGDDY